MNDILAGKVVDMRLEPGDIVYVPDWPLQYLRELHRGDPRVHQCAGE